MRNKEEFIRKAEEIIADNRARVKTKELLEANLASLQVKIKENEQALDISTHALEVLNGISDQVVQEALNFLTKEINAALCEMFGNKSRQIRIDESLFKSQYPQLTLTVVTDDGAERSLKSDSGHGIAQVVSLLSILSLVVITGSRRFLILDEVISGVSIKNREIIDEILWAFAELGFQYIINDHGYIPRGAHVYEFQMVGNVSSIIKDYVWQPNVEKREENLEVVEDTGEVVSR